jgi:hypothetical protein
MYGMKKWSASIDPSTIPDDVIKSENARRNAKKRASYTGGIVWRSHNPKAKGCRCESCIRSRAQINNLS